MITWRNVTPSELRVGDAVCWQYIDDYYPQAANFGHVEKIEGGEVTLLNGTYRQNFNVSWCGDDYCFTVADVGPTHGDAVEVIDRATGGVVAFGEFILAEDWPHLPELSGFVVRTSSGRQFFYSEKYEMRKVR